MASQPTHIYASTLHRRDRCWGRRSRRRWARLALRVVPLAVASFGAGLATALVERLG